MKKVFQWLSKPDNLRKAAEIVILIVNVAQATWGNIKDLFDGKNPNPLVKEIG
ncbi:MAG: hypothetical protein MI974_19030 [Chitinophagales bacterium]|nr:hypothetical protein [Chitinophagales bacterium]